MKTQASPLAPQVKETNKLEEIGEKNGHLVVSFPPSQPGLVTPHGLRSDIMVHLTVGGRLCLILLPFTSAQEPSVEALSGVMARNVLPRWCSLSNVIAPQHLLRRH